jgi:hypothetical protein
MAEKKDLETKLLDASYENLSLDRVFFFILMISSHYLVFDVAICRDVIFSLQTLFLSYLVFVDALHVTIVEPNFFNSTLFSSIFLHFSLSLVFCRLIFYIMTVLQE